MRLFSTGPLSSRGWLAVALIAFCAASATGQGDAALDMLRRMDPPDAALRYTVIGRETALMPWDIAAVDLSESGGITDIFIRLTPEAAGTLAMLTEVGRGSRMVVRICGHVLLETAAIDPNPTGTLYLPNTTAARGEALRALWQGRARCDTLGPEVFANGN